MFDTEEDNMKAYSRFSLPIVTKMDEAEKAKRAKDRPELQMLKYNLILWET